MVRLVIAYFQIHRNKILYSQDDCNLFLAFSHALTSNFRSIYEFPCLLIRLLPQIPAFIEVHEVQCCSYSPLKLARLRNFRSAPYSWLKMLLPPF